MSLIDELSKPTGGREYPRCPVGAALVQLEGAGRDAELDAVLEALRSASWSNPALAEVLTRNGHEMTHNQLGRHRRGQCAPRTCDDPGVGTRS